jgi:AcrR family transcriptional regulator
MYVNTCLPDMTKSPASPRRRDAEQTRDDILRAARIAFATRGYNQVGMREIAAEAGITAALVVRYFGSKRDLFLAAIASNVKTPSFLEGDRATVGRRATEQFMSKPARDADTLSMLLLGAADEEIRDLSVQLLQERITAPLAAWIGGPKAEMRAALILAVISGVSTFRTLLPVKPLSETPDPALVSTLASMIQRLADGAEE